MLDFDKSENSKWRSTRYGRTASLNEQHMKNRKVLSNFNWKGNDFLYFACFYRVLPFNLLTFRKILLPWESWTLTFICEILEFFHKAGTISGIIFGLFCEKKVIKAWPTVLFCTKSLLNRILRKKWTSSSRQGENVYYIVVVINR